MTALIDVTIECDHCCDVTQTYKADPGQARVCVAAKGWKVARNKWGSTVDICPRCYNHKMASDKLAKELS